MHPDRILKVTIESESDLRNKILRTVYTKVAAFALANSKHQSTLEFVFTNKPPNYALYQVDDDHALQSFFEEVWTDEIHSPLVFFDLKMDSKTGNSLSNHFQQDQNWLRTSALLKIKVTSNGDESFNLQKIDHQGNEEQVTNLTPHALFNTIKNLLC